MPEKPRERKANPSQFYKKKKKKKKKKQVKKARVDSREIRNFVRKQIKPYSEALRGNTNIIVLIVLKDTKNMERILFKKDSIGKGITFLSLPIISEEEINNYVNFHKHIMTNNCYSAIINDEYYTLKELVEYLFSVSAETIIDFGRLLILKDCTIIEPRNDYIELNVRPYNLYTWYTDDTTTILSQRVYKGKKLKTFFEIDGNISKTYICYDSLTWILLYRSMVGKIDIFEFLEDHFELSKRQFLKSAFYLLPYDERDEKIEKRFENEFEESQELNSSY